MSLSKSTVLEEYKDCFDKIGRFPDDKYHIQLIDNPEAVVNPIALSTGSQITTV